MMLAGTPSGLVQTAEPRSTPIWLPRSACRGERTGVDPIEHLTAWFAPVQRGPPADFVDPPTLRRRTANTRAADVMDGVPSAWPGSRPRARPRRGESTSYRRAPLTGSLRCLTDLNPLGQPQTHRLRFGRFGRHHLRPNAAIIDCPSRRRRREKGVATIWPARTRPGGRARQIWTSTRRSPW